MTRLRPYRGVLVGAGALLSLLALHGALHAWMLDAQVAAKLFAAGAHLPMDDLLIAVAFLVVRLSAYLVAPGWALYLVVSAVLTARGQRAD